ncbi:hypothetical protein E4U42_000134 [Claviceps africana]|uniref:RING zinc finger-like domain-containing protein n=1 Tax=Claviceps africana TaxID=83212 RepID=A0A8K0JAJ6_9HYPO|nr:hypothetical protein E4U42_000134 [Claviceps africana]
MPPRTSLTSSFSITDTNNEVVCPLRNQDGSSCRKRCIGEKRYRSMQEHIRRAHPEHYVPKLPATEESFLLMINTPPQERRMEQAPSSTRHEAHEGRNSYRDGVSIPETTRPSDEYTTSGRGSNLGIAGAAVALAELHAIEPERDVEMDGGYSSDSDGRRIPRTSIELAPLQLTSNGITSDPYTSNVNRPREILPSLMAHSPPGRSSTLPPLQRPVGPNRPRKRSITKRNREFGHKKKSSRGSAADWLRHIQNDDRFRPSNDRKALSAEPSADYGKRWEDLIDAADQAASAAGDVEFDRTPVRDDVDVEKRALGLIEGCGGFNADFYTPQVPQSPVSIHRGSQPPFSHQQLQPGHYQASPLQQALTPPSNNQDGIDPFPSVESGEGGENCRSGNRGLSDSSPSYSSSQNMQIYCAACQSISPLKNSYACTECICGLCSTCVEVLMAEHGARRKCPRCATIGGRFKPFQLDIR